MSTPQSYTPGHSFLSDVATLSHFPGQALDIEFNDVAATTAQIINNLGLIQRNDGALANASVTYDQLSPALQTAGIAPATAWVTGTNYVVGAAVVQSHNLYRCLIAHTSGLFATDLAAGDWIFVTNIANVSGPAVSVAGNVPKFHDTTGTLLDDSGVPSAAVARIDVGQTFAGTQAFGTLTATTVNGNAITAGTGALTLNNNVLQVGGSGVVLALVGTGASTVQTFPSTSATIARTDAGQTFTGTNAFGVLTATTINGNTFTAGTGVLTIAAAKTLTVSNSLTLAGTDGTTQTFPATSGTIVTSVSSNAVTNAMAAQMGAATLKGNPSNATANATDFTIQGLTARGAPDAVNDKIPIYDNAAGTIKYITPAQVAGASSGTVTSLTAGGGAVSGTGGQTAITTSGTIYAPNGHTNKLRNSSLTSWFHGQTATITTAGGWGAEGIYIVPTGASAAAALTGSGLANPLTFYAQKITGATSVTDVTVRFVIESFDAAPLAGQQVTFQVPVLNNTGASITPTLTVKHASTQDATYTNVDVTAATLQTIANGATGVLTYSWTASAGSNAGISIDVDFGNNFSANTKSIQIGGGFDCRVTPGVSTGTVANPPTPEIPYAAIDIAWNKRFYRMSFANLATSIPVASHNNIVSYASGGNGTASGGNSIVWDIPMRATPTVVTYDGAGNVGKQSTRQSSAWTDNQLGASNVTSDVNGFTFDVNFAAIVNTAMHYTADATLVGG